jgi:predicted ester cyclase
MSDWQQKNQRNKALVWDFWQRMNHAGYNEIPELINRFFHRDIDWNGSQPINQLRGPEAVSSGFWQPLRQSFPDIKRTADIFMGGRPYDLNDGVEWVSGTGYLTGTFDKDWLGIPATGEKTNIRFGQFYMIRDDKIVESYLILDTIAVMNQAGFQVLPPSLGADGGKVLAPRGRDGVLLTEQDELETHKTMQLTTAMGAGMSRYISARDKENLNTMGQQHYWDPDFHWYGPSGIGASHNLEEYQDFHQRPWLVGFGDRDVWKQADPGGRITAFTGEGQFAGGGIWDVKFSRHNGEYLNIPATGKMMTMRDFDWYKREGEVLTQNWVPIDIIDLLMQMDVNLFERMHNQIEQRKGG